MKDVTCPYCGYEQDMSPDDHETEITHEVECKGCEKIYGVIIEYNPSYYESEMPCANGEDHTMKKRVRAPRVINGKEEWYCVYCDYTEDRPSDCFHGCMNDKSTCWNCDKS